MLNAIQQIQDALTKRPKPPFPAYPWWRKWNTPREMDIGEHMYHQGAEFVLREWEMEERQKAKRIVGVDIDSLKFDMPVPDPFDVEPSREPEDG